MKRILLINLLLTCLLSFYSCSDFLIEEPKTTLTEEGVYSNDKNIELLLSGLYTQWRNTRQDRGTFVFLLGSDEAKQGGYQVFESSDQGALDKYNKALNASNTTLTTRWDERWPIVNSTAKVIKFATSEELRAKATFLRAAINFELAMYWGEIPIIDLDNMREARQPIKDVFEFIIKDLEYASTHLPETQIDKKFPVRDAAIALLGKVYLYAPEETTLRDYAKAIGYFDNVISKHSLLPNYADLFNPSLDQNSSEIIYAFQFTDNYPDNNLIQRQAGSRAVADLSSYCYFGGYDLLLPTEYCFKDKTSGGVWELGDNRKHASIRYDLTLPDGTEPRLSWTGQTDELDPHIKKYEDQRIQGVKSFWSNGGGLVYYLRLSDILLCKAECMNELDQTSGAVELVNSTVRVRAFGGNIPAEAIWSSEMSKEEFRNQIMDERMRELCFEGWRRMDLIRTGKLVQLIKERNPWAKAEGTISEYHNLYPIPESEIKQNELINEEDQNPGY